ncbi:MAG: zinc ribbon domain-containing protein [Pyrinomonadaceae bacterium]|nr:zinc ribbon domain-containing protein [Pyrinomonadaceae bacterium]
MTEKITCPGCGTEELKEATFCSNCNAALHPPPEIINSETVAGTSTVEIPGSMKTIHEHIPSSPDASEQKPQNPVFLFGVVGLIALILVLVLVGAVVFAYYFFTSLDVGKLVPTDSATVVPARTASPLKTPAPPPIPVVTERSSFIVKANDKEWQVSEIAVDNSQMFNTEVRGAIVLDGIGANVGPSGIALAPERRVFKEFLTGSLLMRIRFPDGKTSVVQSAALSDIWQTEENEKGVIEFLINDNAPEKNKGMFLFSAKLENEQ